MSADFDWLDYLSMLNPKGSLSATSGRGGVMQVTREDVLAALAGINPLAEMLVYARLGMLTYQGLADKTKTEAFIAAISLLPEKVSTCHLDDFAVAWRVACYVDIVEHNQAVLPARSAGKIAGVCRQKWLRLEPILPVCQSIITLQWGVVRAALRKHLSMDFVSKKAAW